jgi:hypothetical protein
MQDPAQYTAAQAVRSEIRGDGAWPELNEAIRAKVDELARRAFRQELVLFLGAGVSQSAGLPSWNGLLRDLAGPDLAKDPNFTCLGALDQARVIQRRRAIDDLGAAVAARIQADHYSLAHGLLAALPVQEVVTTNYDNLFEAASEAISRPVDVLPYQLAGEGRRWLLKLHGCVSQPEDIVLTREDYLRYDVERGALAGLVQGLLITRHMLFIGFSLGDDNFHRIADAVRRAVQREPFGTSLSVAGNPLLREVWSRDLDWIELGELPGSARLLEIFLDRLAARAVATADYLFDPKYQSVLSEPETRLRDQLTGLADFVGGVPGQQRQGAPWAEVERLLGRLGHPAHRQELHPTLAPQTVRTSRPTSVWDGVTQPDTLSPEVLEIRQRVADAAHGYNWSRLLTTLAEHPELVNSTRPGSGSRFAPLHQAAYGKAPIEVVERLLALGAWRTLRNARGERPVDVAARRGHRQIMPVLEPVLKRQVPLGILLKIQEHFHAVIRECAGGFIEGHALRLPELEPLLEMDYPSVEFDIPGMMGGFSYELVKTGVEAKLFTKCCSRFDGRLLMHEITAAKATPVQNECDTLG